MRKDSSLGRYVTVLFFLYLQKIIYLLKEKVIKTKVKNLTNVILKQKTAQ